MKTKILQITIALLAIAVSLNAQNTDKKIHLTLSKEINGEKITVDTIIDSNESHKALYYTINENGELQADSLLKDFDVIEKDGVKIICLTSENIDSDSLKVWLSAEGDCKGKEGITIKLDANSSWIDTDENVTIFGDDSLNIVKDIVISSDKNGMMVIGGNSKNLFIHNNSNTDSADFKVIKITEDISVDKSNVQDVNIYVTSSLKADDKSVSKVFLNSESDDCKTIELTFNTDDESVITSINSLSESLKGAGENVIITKHETEDGMLHITAEISDCELTKEEKQQAKNAGLEDETELQLTNFKAYPNPTEGIFNIEFEAESKKTTLVKIYDKEGKEVYSEKIKKMTGMYSKEIDLSKENNGLYFVRIIQGNKSTTKKIIKN